MSSSFYPAALTAIGLLLSLPARAQPVVFSSNYTGHAGSFASYPSYFGQDFTVPSGPISYYNVQFEFLDDGTSSSAGNAYLFTSPYSGTVDGLATSSYLATAAAVDGAYDFSSATVLQSGQTYYLYEDAPIEVYDNNLAGATDYFVGYPYSPLQAFEAFTDFDILTYQVSGTPTPELDGQLGKTPLAVFCFMFFVLADRRKLKNGTVVRASAAHRQPRSVS